MIPEEAKEFDGTPIKGYVVYFLVRREEIVYVGYTKSLHKRVKQHSKKEFSAVWHLGPFETRSKAMVIEKKWIDALDPEYNGCPGRPPLGDGFLGARIKALRLGFHPTDRNYLLRIKDVPNTDNQFLLEFLPNGVFPQGNAGKEHRVWWKGDGIEGLRADCSILRYVREVRKPFSCVVGNDGELIHFGAQT